MQTERETSVYIHDYDADDLIDAIAESLAYGEDSETFDRAAARKRVADDNLIAEHLDYMLTYDADIREAWDDIGQPEPTEYEDGVIASMVFAIHEEIDRYAAEITEEAVARAEHSLED